MYKYTEVDLEANENAILAMADDMAAAATSFSSHGYDTFIRSREAFKAKLKEIFDKS